MKQTQNGKDEIESDQLLPTETGIFVKEIPWPPHRGNSTKNWEPLGNRGADPTLNTKSKGRQPG